MRTRDRRAEGRRARRRRGQRSSRRLADEPCVRTLPNKPLLAGALLGLAIAGYLTAVTWLDTKPVGCAAGSGCSLVQASRFASLLGIPVAAWGVTAYGALAAIALFVRDARLHSRLALALSGAAVAVSIYLTAVSILELGGTCAWCLASLGAVTVCFGVAVAQERHRSSSRVFRRRLAAVVGFSAVLVVGLHLYYEAQPLRAADEADDPRLRALALHLRESGARFYGASSCPHCSDQKALFRDAASLLPYVECAPEGPREPQARVCRDEGIERYPTWVIRGERHEGILTLDALAAQSGFERPGSFASSPGP